ncbi:hypothetical protein EVC62_03880 [Salinicola endophyticus]|uniref:HTH marR-type domain-containing protein n=1 Tax=Salinicola endophyticus TaxID=1949083 RepID=A0ABY8FDS6_9GAMM|nr:MarR family transcriptional regulator [Salinicola endophyticus]WFF40707.1 hypothetical protein EVC62_03880 [Salinicola endophyticus]
MPERGQPELDVAALERRFTALQAAHPELDPLAVLLLALLRGAGPGKRAELASPDSAHSAQPRSELSRAGLSSAQLSRHLGIEHALVRRAAAELEAAGWIDTQARGGASPALWLRLITDA